jgi:hypothetical protein
MFTTIDPHKMPKVLALYLKITQYPILARRIRERMRQEIFSRGIISRKVFIDEVREKAVLSQKREGLFDPFAQELPEVWEERLRQIRDHLTDFYFAYNLPHELFEDIVQEVMAESLSAWRRGQEDPYVVGAVIEEPEKFYGRRKILAQILAALRTGNHLAIYGERRIGKTSLLHQLAHRLQKIRDTPRAYLHLPVFVNLQIVPEARFFYALIRAIARIARPYLNERGQTLPSLVADERSEGYDSLDMANDLERVLESLHEVTNRPVRIVLLLDEADKMNGYDPHTQEGLRGLLMTPLGRQVKLVWSGQTMNREWHLETSPWFNLFKHEIHLIGLEEKAAVHLIRQPVKGVFTYNDEAVTRILHYSDRRPYTIQRLCSFCVRQLLAENRFRVTVEDVETAYRAMQDEDARRAAQEAASQAIYASHAPVQSLAEDQDEYKADESRPEEEA